MKPIRILELRAARNGWVLTAFEREGDVRSNYTHSIYCSMVAETPEKAAEIVLDLLKSDDWEQNVFIPPARPESV